MQEITKALVKFQKEVKNPEKSSNNPFFNSKYVDLDGLIHATKECLSENDLFLTQKLEVTENGTILKTVVMHVSGESIESTAPIKPTKPDIHGFASAITYMRRYSLESILGICGTVDDDGNAATDIKPPANGPLNNNSPTEKMKKKLWALLYKKYKGQKIPKEQADFVEKCTGEQCSKAIERLEAELDS